MRDGRGFWLRMAVATVLFAVVLVAIVYVTYGGAALFTVKGAVGIVVQTAVFALAMGVVHATGRPRPRKD